MNSSQRETVNNILKIRGLIFQTPQDRQLYAKLLFTSLNSNPDLAYILHGFRCVGTKLQVTETGIRLQPVIDPEKGWSSQEEYNENRKYLIPYQDYLIRCFKDLAKVA